METGFPAYTQRGKRSVTHLQPTGKREAIFYEDRFYRIGDHGQAHGEKSIEGGAYPLGQPPKSGPLWRSWLGWVPTRHPSGPLKPDKSGGNRYGQSDAKRKRHIDKLCNQCLSWNRLLPAYPDWRTGNPGKAA